MRNVTLGIRSDSVSGAIDFSFEKSFVLSTSTTRFSAAISDIISQKDTKMSPKHI